MADCAKCKFKKREGLVGCEGSCNKWFHTSCISMTENEFKLLDKCKNLFYLCDVCRINCNIVNKETTTKLNQNMQDIESKVTDLAANVSEDVLNKIIHNQYQVMLQHLDTIFTSFKSDLQQLLSAKIENINKSLQYVAENVPQSATMACNKTSSSFILKPKNLDQTISTTKSDILHNIDPVESNISISKVKTARNGGIVISCNSGNESDKFKDLANHKLGDKYDVKQLPSLNPRVKVVGFSEKIDGAVLLNYIKSQNKQCFSEDSVCQLINIYSLKKNKNLFQALIQVDRITYQKIMTSGKLFVGYDYCSVFDGIAVRRCFNCCGFHHVANQCLVNAPICPKCSESHVVNECKSTTLKCVNCFKLKNTLNANIQTDHAAWDLKCHVYKETLKRFKANILGNE